MVTCPHCGGKFDSEEAVNHDLRERLQKDFERRLEERSVLIEEKIRRSESDRYRLQIAALQQDASQKSLRVKSLEEEAISLRQKEQRIRDREENLEVEMRKRLLEREALLKEQLEKTALDKALLQVREREQRLAQEKERLEIMLKKRVQEETEKARDEEKMKMAELQKKLDDQTKLINEMKRKSEQGSMQMQGEIQELVLEEYLRVTFPRDEVEEIAKGKRGGDCVHIIKDHYNRICGKVLYESKRTKHFAYDWIPKLKEDMRLKQAEIGVLVTEALPEGMTRFGEIEGIWVCSFQEFKALSILFRSNLSRLGEILASQENRGEKMNMIYRYVTGTEFRQKLEGAFESYREMQDDLVKEKTVMMSQFAKREKKLLKAMENLVNLYGDVRGIAGGAVQEIRCLETGIFAALG